MWENWGKTWRFDLVGIKITSFERTGTNMIQKLNGKENMLKKNITKGKYNLFLKL